MIEIAGKKLVFKFPEIHKDAIFEVELQRTLRIPDDDKKYPLPPGFGPFPLEDVLEYKTKLPEKWVKEGGVFYPMHLSEAMFINFKSTFVWEHNTDYPFAIKIASGKRSALTGNVWTKSLRDNDYCVVPGQRWLDGFVVENGVIRQFIAVPMGAGVSVEEQLTEKADVGGLQIQVHPMKREVFEKKYPKRETEHGFLKTRRRSLMGNNWCGAPGSVFKSSKIGETVEYSSDSINYLGMDCEPIAVCACAGPAAASFVEPESDSRMVKSAASIKDMGFGAGGSMKQQVFEDKHGVESWETEVENNKCFIHIMNAEAWEYITGSAAPNLPLTAKDYAKYGFPFYDYYKSEAAIDATSKMKEIKSVSEMEKEKDISILPENKSTIIDKVVPLSTQTTPHKIQPGEW